MYRKNGVYNQNSRKRTEGNNTMQVITDNNTKSLCTRTLYTLSPSSARTPPMQWNPLLQYLCNPLHNCA